MAPTLPPVRKSYFANYCGDGPYDRNYVYYSGVDHCISIAERFEIEARRVLVLGTATGRVLEHFDAAWGVRPWGCELSRWAHGRIPRRYRGRIRRADMRDYVPSLVRAGERFDLLFCNSLVYLQAREMPAFVDLCSRVARYLHFWSSTSEDHAENDRDRVTLRPRIWWRDVFCANGFAPTRSRYLWRSTRLAAQPRR